MFLLVLAGLVLIATFLYISSMAAAPDMEAMSEIQAPDNSSGKAVPRLYGKVRLWGNNIYYGGLTAVAIEEESGGK